MNKFLVFLLICLPFLHGCDEDGNPINPFGSELTDEEIVEGLKKALNVGTDTSVSVVSQLDGYFKDEAIKLLLPEELNTAISSFKSKSITVLGSQITGEQLYSTGFSSLGINSLQGKENDLILGINRAAETAAKEAAPIFTGAIQNMSIAQGRDILFGGVDTAATSFLNQETRPNLFSQYEPKIESALNSVQISGKPVSSIYEEFISDYNSILNTKATINPLSNTTIGSLMSLNPIQVTDLSAYSTNKGLDGLFLKIGEEEKNIRENPFAYVSDILQKVFGALGG